MSTGISWLDQVFADFEDLYPQNLDHGIDHHITVAKLIRELVALDGLNEDEEWVKVALFCGAIHDTVDYKFEPNLELVQERVSSRVPFDSKDIMDIITSMSWSKRRTNDDGLRKELLPIRDLAMYADWIEAMTLERCIAYNSRFAKGKDLIDGVNKHFGEKLVHLIKFIPERYHSIALPRHQKMLDDLFLFNGLDK